MAGIVVELLQGSGGNPLTLMLLKDDDANLGPRVQGGKVCEVCNTHGLAIGHDNLSQLPVLENVVVLALKVLTDGIVGIGHVAGSPLPQFMVILYPIDEFQVFRFEGTKGN